MKKPFLALGLIFASTLTFAQDLAPPAQTLDTLFKSYSADTAPYFPFAASENGAHKYDSVFANGLSDEYRKGLKAICVKYQSELHAIEKSALPPQDKLNYDVFDYGLDNCIRSFNYPWHLLPINQVGGSWTSNFPVMGAGKGQHPFKTVRNYEDFLSRIDGFVIWMDTAVARMREGVAQGVTQPGDIMLKVMPQLDAQIVDDPTKSMFYEPIAKFPADFDDEAKKVLKEKYIAAIQTKIVPAYRRMRSFIQDEYLPKCRTTVGLRDLPGGVEMYREAVRAGTTTDLTSAQIYEIGLSEVQRITGEIDALHKEIKTSSDAPLAQYSTVDDLLAAYREFRSSVEVKLPQYFSRLPKADFEIRAIEAFREKSMPTSYIGSSADGSRAGVFYLNTEPLKTAGHAVVSRSLFMHEAIPGHHLQFALQRENRQLPLYRRSAWYGSYGEGWALYVEGLGQEMGMYQNRRDRLIMLGDEIYRAARLVVDVGIHDKGWTKQQAVDYMKKVGHLSEENAVREVERYMAWPGQALSYKIGQLKILELRRKAEQSLGTAFDIRAFHDEVLKDGAMPLSILELKINRWIAEQLPKEK